MPKCLECGIDLVSDVELLPDNQCICVLDGDRKYYCAKCYCTITDKKRGTIDQQKGIKIQWGNKEVKE